MAGRDARGNRELILLLLLGLLLLAGITLFAYRALTMETNLSPEDLRFTAERILYLGILLTLLFLVVGIVLFLKGLKTARRLARLVEQSRYRRLSLQSDFRGFGRFGKELKELYGGILELNEMMGRKIAAQGTLLELLISNSNARILVTDSGGRIIYISKALAEEIEIEKQEAIGGSVENIWEEIRFGELRPKLEEQLQAVEIETTAHPLTAYPVAGPDGLISYVVFNTERKPFLHAPKAAVEEKRKTNPIQRELNRLLKLGRRRKDSK